MKSSGRLDFLDAVRGVAIIMVVAIHAVSYVPSLPETVVWFVDVFCKTIAVPIFFIVDGYIFHLKSRSLNYSTYMISSFKRLIVPWLSFLLIYSCARFVFEYFGDAERYIYKREFFEVVAFSYNSVVAVQLYFLPALFLVRLTFPLLKVINDLHLYGKLTVFFGYITLYHTVDAGFLNVLSVEGGLEPVRHALWGGQFYLVGMILSTFIIKDLWRYLFPVVSVALFFAGAYFDESAYKYLFQYAYLLSVFFLSVFFGGVMKWLGQYTMAIYLLHAPVLMKAISLGLLTFLTEPIVVFMLLMLLTCVASVVIYKQCANYSALRPLFGDQLK